MVMCRYSCDINHYTALNLTKLDILDDFDEILVGTEYLIDGKPIDYFPADLEILGKVEVKYETLPGWKRSTMGVTKWDDLAENARQYVEFVEREAGGIPIRWIGTGPAREHLIEL